MKKIIVIFLVILIGLTASSQKSTDQALDKMVNEICGCIMPKINKLHPQLKKLIENMATKDEAVAQQEFSDWLTTAKPEEQEKINKGLVYMDSVGVELVNCISNVSKKYPELEKEGSSDLLINKMLQALENKKDCKMLSALMKIGQKK